MQKVWNKINDWLKLLLLQSSICCYIYFLHALFLQLRNNRYLFDIKISWIVIPWTIQFNAWKEFESFFCFKNEIISQFWGNYFNWFSPLSPMNATLPFAIRRMWSSIWNSWDEGWWIEQMIVLPCDAISLSREMTLIAMNESNPLVGSSQNIIDGFVRIYR